MAAEIQGSQRRKCKARNEGQRISSFIEFSMSTVSSRLFAGSDLRIILS